MATVIYGRDTSDAESDYGDLGIGDMRLCVFDPTSVNGWAYQIKVFMGRISGGANALAKLVVYDTDSGKDPDAFLGRTGQITVSTTMADLNGGQEYTASIVDAPRSPSDNAIKITNNKRLAVGILNLPSSSRTIRHSMQQSAFLPSGTDNRSFYYINSAGDPPEDTLESSDWSESTEGHITIALVIDVNAAPLVPDALAPVGFVSEVTPVFTGSFRDMNGNYGASHSGADRGDILNRVRIKVYTTATRTSTLWDFEYAASSVEQAANAFSRSYGGTALTRGVTYYWEAQVSDQHGAWSPLTAMQSFTPSSLGTITLDGTPNGKTDDFTPDFQFKWTHAGGLSTDAVQIRLYRNGSLLKTSPIITKTVVSSTAPGTLGTITAAESTFGTLDAGQNYAYVVAGRDTNGQWSAWPASPSTAWRTFNTDYAPTIPTRVTPANGSIVTSLPPIRVKSTDVDDTVLSGLETKVRIKTKENIDNYNFSGGDITSWGLHAANSVTATASYEATVVTDPGALKINVTAGSSPNEYQYRTTDYLPCVAGESYTWQCFGRKDHATDIDIRLGILWRTAAGADISISWGAYGSDQTTIYEGLNVTGVAPATAERMHIIVGVKCMVTISTARNAYFDVFFPINAQTKFIRSMTQSGDYWDYTPTSTDVPTYMQVWWDTYAYDGTVYSGGSLTTPQYSVESTFTYALGPVVTVSSPADGAVLTTNRPTWDWNDVTNRTHFRVQAWDAGTTNQRLDTGWVNDPASIYQALAGVFHDGDSIDSIVSVRDNLALEGSSATVSFTIALTPPDQLTNVTIVPLSLNNSPWEDVFRIAWEESVDPNFDHYLVTSYESGQDPNSAHVYFETSSVSDTLWIHKFPRHGIERVYNVYQVINVNGDYIESSPVELRGTIELGGASLIDVNDPTAMRRMSFEFVDKRNYNFSDDQTEFQTWGKRKTLTLYGNGETWAVPSKFFLVDRDGLTADQQLSQLMTLVTSTDDYSAPKLYGYRDEKSQLFFIKISSGPNITHEEFYYIVDMNLKEEYYLEYIR